MHIKQIEVGDLLSYKPRQGKDFLVEVKSMTENTVLVDNGHGAIRVPIELGQVKSLSKVRGPLVTDKLANSENQIKFRFEAEGKYPIEVRRWTDTQLVQACQDYLTHCCLIKLSGGVEPTAMEWASVYLIPKVQNG